MPASTTFHRPNEWEQRLLHRFLDDGVPGYRELREQIAAAEISDEEADSSGGYFHLRIPDGCAPLPAGLPYPISERWGRDADGGFVHYMLHYDRTGKVTMLERYRIDPVDLHDRFPDPKSLRIDTPTADELREWQNSASGLRVVDALAEYVRGLRAEREPLLYVDKDLAVFCFGGERRKRKLG